ncbi:DUF6887 family protein [Plectonema radiosum]|uniref:DUF6887 family protein n=1 Tax=Plectonema radiosum TaxID=945768 RepID=UPI0035C8ABC1
MSLISPAEELLAYIRKHPQDIQTFHKYMDLSGISRVIRRDVASLRLYKSFS